MGSLEQANPIWAECRSDADSELTYTLSTLFHTSELPVFTAAQNVASLISAGILNKNIKYNYMICIGMIIHTLHFSLSPDIEI